MLLIEDEFVKSFLSHLTSQISEWLKAGKLQKLVLVIMSKATGEVLERWNFRIQTDNEVVEKGVSRETIDKKIMRDLQAIMRQVASNIIYLPCLDEACVFDVLASTETDVAVPFTWIESDPKLVANPQLVKLHGFDTKLAASLVIDDSVQGDRPNSEKPLQSNMALEIQCNTTRFATWLETNKYSEEACKLTHFEFLTQFTWGNIGQAWKTVTNSL